MPRRSFRPPEPAAGPDSGPAGRVPLTAPRRPPPGTGCALCARAVPLTFHHLIPKETHHRAWFRARYSKAEMRAHGVWICRACHDGLHDLYDEVTLARRFSTLEALQADEAVMRHAAWAARQRRV